MWTNISPWYIAGPLVGLIIVGLRFAVNKPFGALGGYIDVVENGLSPKRLGFRSWLLLGLVLGGLSFALISGRFSLTFAYGDPGSIAGTSLLSEGILLGVAGIVMGFGARLAGGCTSGHGMSGLSLLSPASIVATMTFFATAVGLAFVVAMLGGGS
jgi:uncharacterized membrane protein YedE/YeeE